MRDQPRQLIILIEDHTVRTRRTAIVDLSGAEDRELVVGRVHGEVKVLVVVVLVRVLVVADRLTLLVQVEAGLLGFGHGGLVVAGFAAGVVAGLGGGVGAGEGDEGEENGEDLYHSNYVSIGRVVGGFDR